MRFVIVFERSYQRRLKRAHALRAALKRNARKDAAKLGAKNADGGKEVSR